jgi:glycosyltransferase involved in cell wall biosynthesis
LIEAFLKARTRSRGGDVRLVMSGEAGKDREELQAIFSRSDLQGAAVRVGDIPMEDMSVLLGAAEGMIFAASDGEFGYPIVQAMACGCPVIVTRPPVVDGVAGDAVLQAEATNTEDIARKMGTLLMDAHIQKEMRRRGFARSAGSSWNDIARRILKILGA